MAVAVLANSEYAVVYLRKDYAPLAALVPFLMACTKSDLCIAHMITEHYNQLHVALVTFE